MADKIIPSSAFISAGMKRPRDPDDPPEEQFGDIDDELWASAQLSHRIDDSLPPPPRPPPPVLRYQDYVGISSSCVRAILIGTRRYSMSTMPTKLAVVDVPSTMTIKDLRKELYVRALSSGGERSQQPPSQEELQESYCDYEFSLCRHKECSFGLGEPLLDSSVCGDCVSPDKRVLAVRAGCGRPYSGSIRTLVPGNYERQEKHALMNVMRSLPQRKFAIVVLSVGACEPEQVMPNFAIEAARNGHRVCVLSVNPGFFHGLYRELDGEMSRESTLRFLAYSRHPPQHTCTTEFDRVRAWESWRQTSRGDFAGSFVLDRGVRESLRMEYVEMHTFGMSWPGRPANRELDDSVLKAVSETIQCLCARSCHFIPVFSTWSDETDFHVSQLREWRAQVSSPNYFHAIFDQYDQSPRFLIYANIDSAMSNVLGRSGRGVQTLAEVSLEDLGLSYADD